MIPYFTAFIIFIIVASLCFLYKKYEDKLLTVSNCNNDNCNIIKKYFFSDEDENDFMNGMKGTKKPILWIHINYDYNSRNWLSFGSRSSYDLNQNYIYFTIKSIIMNCDESFKIVMIDDTTFNKLLPTWKIDMSSLPDPIKNYTRELGMAKLVYQYGGMKVPSSFLCFKDLSGLSQREL